MDNIGVKSKSWVFKGTNVYINTLLSKNTQNNRISRMIWRSGI